MMRHAELLSSEEVGAILAWAAAPWESSPPTTMSRIAALCESWREQAETIAELQREVTRMADDWWHLPWWRRELGVPHFRDLFARRP